MKKIIFGFSSVFILSLFLVTSLQAQALTHLVGKGGVEFSVNYLFYERELKYIQFKVEGEEYTDAQLNSLNRDFGIKSKNPIYYLQTTFGFAGNTQLQIGVGMTSQDLKFNDKTEYNDDVTLEKNKTVFVKLGLGGGYHFPFGLLFTGRGAVSIYPLTDMGDTTNFEGDGAYGEWEIGLTGGYDFKPVPLINLTPFLGFEYTGALEYLSGTSYDDGSESDLDLRFREKKSTGIYFGLDLNWKELFLKGEGHFGARKGFFLQTGVRL